ncbi:MAG TPA: extracellular solute-binding protein [Streptosporangiaceae bacterium]|nr:extracellular solute-binding protein [Streptosporangiaceae bacterium]
MGLRKTPAALVAFGAAAALAIAGCSSSSSNTPSAGSSSGSSNAPASITVWRMGGSVPSEVAWMNGVTAQFKQQFPQYKNTKINVDWIPWTSRTTDWNNALASGKNAPDITELGNTDTPTEASLGVLANISSYVNSWSNKSGLIAGELANDNQNGNDYAVPWFGGVRGIWYRTDQFQKAGITSTPTTWADLVTDAQKLMKTFPGTYGIDAITDDSNAFASFIWGSGGQIATQSGGKWTADLTSPQDEAAIKWYVSLYRTYHLSPSQYIGQTELGPTGSTAGGANTDFALGKLDMYIDGPWASAEFPKNATDKANWASFPIPSQNGTPVTAPVFAGGSDLAVFATSKNQQADWDLISVMDNESNSLTFANSQGFFPPYTSELSNQAYTGQLMSGFAKAASNAQLAPLNAKNWATADTGKYFIIPDMLKALMNGAPFQSTVAAANSQLQQVLNTGTES